MRALATVALLGGTMVAAPLALEAPAALTAAASIGACVLAAGLACEGFTAFAVACGALGALAYHAFASGNVVLAGAAAVALVLAPRTARAPTRRWRAIHGAASAIGGGTAAWVAWRYGGESAAAVRAAAVLVAGLFASATLALPSDDAVTYALVASSHALPGAPGDHLLRAAALRRRTRESPTTEALARETAARIEQAWRALADIAAQRVALAPGGGAAVLDGRIAQHVEGLERIHTAADERLARAAGLSDQRLAAARMDGESIEAEVRALVEVGPP